MQSYVCWLDRWMLLACCKGFPCLLWSIFGSGWGSLPLSTHYASFSCLPGTGIYLLWDIVWDVLGWGSLPLSTISGSCPILVLLHGWSADDWPHNMKLLLLYRGFVYLGLFWLASLLWILIAWVRLSPLFVWATNGVASLCWFACLIGLH